MHCFIQRLQNCDSAIISIVYTDVDGIFQYGKTIRKKNISVYTHPTYADAQIDEMITVPIYSGVMNSFIILEFYSKFMFNKTYGFY